MPPFTFPGPAFAWTFCSVLLVMLGLASYEDIKRMVIPKWLSLPLLALGILFNVVRGGWVAASGGGLVDGFMVSLAGFGTGFGLFLAMWLLGTCGGGDVKLFAAVGAWTGPLLAVFILIGTLILVVVSTVGKVVWRLASGKPLLAGPTLAARGSSGKGVGKDSVKRRQPLATYSFPVALSSACVLLWVFRFELRLAPKPPEPFEQARLLARP